MTRLVKFVFKHILMVVFQFRLTLSKFIAQIIQTLASYLVLTQSAHYLVWTPQHDDRDDDDRDASR